MHPFLPAFGSGRRRYVRVDELASARIIVLQYYFEHIETETDVLEQVSPRDVFEAVGHVEGTVSQPVISGTLKGILALVSNPPFRTLDAYCPGDHPFVMVRR
jgi:hypothetical protein